MRRLIISTCAGAFLCTASAMVAGQTEDSTDRVIARGITALMEGHLGQGRAQFATVPADRVAAALSRATLERPMSPQARRFSYMILAESGGAETKDGFECLLKGIPDPAGGSVCITALQRTTGPDAQRVGDALVTRLLLCTKEDGWHEEREGTHPFLRNTDGSLALKDDQSAERERAWSVRRDASRVLHALGTIALREGFRSDAALEIATQVASDAKSDDILRVAALLLLLRMDDTDGKARSSAVLETAASSSDDVAMTVAGIIAAEASSGNLGTDASQATRARTLGRGIATRMALSGTEEQRLTAIQHLARLHAMSTAADGSPRLAMDPEVRSTLAQVRDSDASTEIRARAMRLLKLLDENQE